MVRCGMDAGSCVSYGGVDRELADKVIHALKFQLFLSFFSLV